MRTQQHCAARRSILAIALIVSILIQASPSFACGPFSLDAVFTFTIHPEYPLEKFAAGNIGVVRPSYARSYLYVAYQYFNGSSFNAIEQQALVDLWRDRLDFRWQSGEEQAVQAWLSARQKVVPGSAPKIDVYRSTAKPGQYDTYLNCQNDAFENAATALEAKLKQSGSDSSAIKQWVEAQDQVFSNCSEGQQIPAALPAGTEEALRADRDYQIAAANFYGGNFDLARTQFAAISQQPKSPWQSTAAYLVARALVRKASLGSDDTKTASLIEAEEQINSILADQKLQSSHAPAKRLLSIVRLRLRPEARLHELGVSLVSTTEPANLKQDLWDYTVLLDQLGGDEESHHQKANSAPANLHGDDLTDWITTLQSEKPEALEYSISRWQATSSVPWLIAALSKVGAQNEKAAMLQAAAAKIPLSSPAFASASFESARLDIAAGRFAEARTRLDGLLQKDGSLFNRSSRNLLHQQRMLVATDLNDFLVHAQRVPAGFSWDDGGREIPVDEAEFGEELKTLQGKALFDIDAGQILNQRMPVSILGQAANNTHLPDHLRRDVTQAAWLRAVLLDNPKMATALVPTLKSLVPEMTPLLNEYLRAADPAAKKFSALFAWLKFPGLEPIVDTGSGRGALGLAEQDSYRDNWWCSAAFAVPEGSKAAKKLEAEDQAHTTAPSFLTASQRAAGDKEYASLEVFGAAPNYLSRQVLEWAAKNPNDPRVPEALHLAVKTSRYGCTDKQSGKWSKAAYDFLHQRYPSSEWAKKTPYWFKN